MRKILTIVILLCSSVSWAQSEIEENIPILNDIASRWTQKNIPVTVTHKGKPVHDYAQAICAQFSDYLPNAYMVDYLSSPGNYTYEEKHYLVEDDPRHGFIKIDGGGQFDFMTEVCYWKRKNGHALVAVLLQIGHEGEGQYTDAALLFYDFNPKTHMLTPDMLVKRDVDTILARHDGKPNFELPKEDKDISLSYTKWDPEEDFIFEDYTLKWTGNSFREVSE